MQKKQASAVAERAETRGAVSRAVGWSAFFVAICLGWLFLWVMGQERSALEGRYGLDLLVGLCAADATGMRPGTLLAMWALMAAAMMAPTAVPAFATWGRLPPAASGGAVGMALVVTGYLAVWITASAGFAGLQMLLMRNGLAAPDGASLSFWLTAGLFAAAGLYQFSWLKSACLVQCRAPLTFFMAHWRPGRVGALAAGGRLGVVCLGCCWALMGLAFVGGMSNLLWMGLAMLLMVMEKLPNMGRPLTRPLGAALIALALVSAARAIGGT